MKVTISLILSFILSLSFGLELDTEQKEYIIEKLRGLSDRAKAGEQITEFGEEGLPIDVLDPTDIGPGTLESVNKVTLVFHSNGQVDAVDMIAKNLVTLMSSEGVIDDDILAKTFNPEAIEQRVRKAEAIMKEIKREQKKATRMEGQEPIEKTIYSRDFTIFNNYTAIAKFDGKAVRFDGKIDFDTFYSIFPEDLLAQIEIKEEEPIVESKRDGVEESNGLGLVRVAPRPRPRPTSSSAEGIMLSGRIIVILTIISSLASCRLL